MASTADQMPRNLLGPDLRSAVHSVVLPFGQANKELLEGGDLAARAVTAAGLAALVALPALLLVSLIMDAPLAVPAVIALGYLAVSHAISARKRRRAALLNAIVLGGLVGWLVLYLLSGDNSVPDAGIAAALLAPLFAAAPALARSLLASKTSPTRDVASLMRAAALQRVAFIEETMPSERLLVLDRAGTVLAATAAAQKTLGLLPDAIEYGLNGVIAPDELPQTLDAIRRCHRDGRTADIPLRIGMEAAPVLAANLSSCADGAVAMRVVEPPRAEVSVPRRDNIAEAATDLLEPPSCDVSPALEFALQRLERRPRARRVQITSSVEPYLAIACDRQIGRRILALLVECGASGCAAGGSIEFSARRVKGVALIRAAGSLGSEANITTVLAEDSPAIDTLRTLVEDAGGTLVIEVRPAEFVISVRLGLSRQRRLST